MSSTVKFPGPLLRSSPRVESEIAWRVAALLSSRREEAVLEGAAVLAPPAVEGVRGEEPEVDTHLHYVHVCTMRKFSSHTEVAG